MFVNGEIPSIANESKEYLENIDSSNLILKMCEVIE